MRSVPLLPLMGAAFELHSVMLLGRHCARKLTLFESVNAPNHPCGA